MHLRLLLVTAFVGVLSSSCGGGPIAPSEVDIAGTMWRLTEIQQAGGTTIQIQSPDRFTVTFGDEQRVSVRADCNMCAGGYELAGSELRIGPMACTKAYCGDQSSDTQFLTTLSGSATIAWAGENLVISSGNSALVFKR
jgi:heat shock protein HslJ